MLVLLFLRAHWRALAVLVAAAILFLAGVVVGVKSVRPPPPLPPEVHIETKVAKTEKQEKREEKTDDRQKVRTIVVYRDRTRLPDGTVQEHTETHEGSDTTEHTDARAEVRTETRTVEVEKRVEVPVAAPLPKWRVGALVGIDATHPPLLSDGRVGFGAIVERRIVGPLSVGVWGTHTGSAGLVLTVEF